MKIRFPLYARFLGWFALNLTLLGAVAALLIRSEFRLEALMAGAAGERIQQTAEVLFGELRNRPRPEWNEALDRYRQTYGVTFLVLSEHGEVVAGPELALPEEIRSRLRPGPGPGRRPGHADPPNFLPPLVTERRGPGPGPMRAPRGDGGPLGGPPRAFVRTSNPKAYWMLIRVPMAFEAAGRPEMLRLAVMSPTLSAGGLFFDARPWWLAGGGVLALSVLWWVPFVGRITRTLGQMTAATERIAEGRFDVALNDRRSDELGRLGGGINRMATRLEGFVSGQKRFLGDIAHELCTPLARMELALGVLQQRADERQGEYLNDVHEEVRHMSGLVNELLSFSKAGLKGKDLPVAVVPLRPLLETVVNREAAAGDPVQLSVPEGLQVLAEPELLARAVGNLLRNALRYAGSAGPVSVTASLNVDEVQIVVADVGPGVPEASLARLTEPFYRPDAARTREQGGVGLGLAIVRSCVEACRGTLTLRNRVPAGFEATVRLPKA